MLCSKYTIVGSEDIDDELSVSAPISCVVEDENGGKVNLGKVVALQYG